MLQSRLYFQIIRLRNFLLRARGLATVMPLMDSLKAILWRHDPARVITTKLRNLKVPFTFRPGTSDTLVLHKVFLESEYELPFPIQVRTVVDAGAHIGAATIFYHDRFPDARILAIEPEESNYKLLCENTQALLNVVAIRAALWPHEKELWIQDTAADKAGFHVSATPTRLGNSVASITPQQIFEKLHADEIDIVKLDIEGAELDLFSSGADLWLPRVRCLVLELHDRKRPGCAQSLYAALQQCRFRQEIRGENIFIFLRDMKNNA